MGLDPTLEGLGIRKENRKFYRGIGALLAILLGVLLAGPALAGLWGPSLGQPHGDTQVTFTIADWSCKNPFPGDPILLSLEVTDLPDGIPAKFIDQEGVALRNLQFEFDWGFVLVDPKDVLLVGVSRPHYDPDPTGFLDGWTWRWVLVLDPTEPAGRRVGGSAVLTVHVNYNGPDPATRIPAHTSEKKTGQDLAVYRQCQDALLFLRTAARNGDQGDPEDPNSDIGRSIDLILGNTGTSPSQDSYSLAHSLVADTSPGPGAYPWLFKGTCPCKELAVEPTGRPVVDVKESQERIGGVTYNRLTVDITISWRYKIKCNPGGRDDICVGNVAITVDASKWKVNVGRADEKDVEDPSNSRSEGLVRPTKCEGKCGQETIKNGPNLEYTAWFLAKKGVTAKIGIEFDAQDCPDKDWKMTLGVASGFAGNIDPSVNDHDGDGTPDATDTDDDNDGRADGRDRDPYDPRYQ